MNKESTEQQFLELIRVSLGVSDGLSLAPEENEWKQLFDIASVQALQGVCFAGVRKLAERQMTAPKEVYYTWMATAAMMQSRNEELNSQCVALQEKLAGHGMKSCILKGQGIAALYQNGLAMLRQPGDIDVWVDDAPERLYAKIRSIGVEVAKPNIHHGVAGFFPNTIVEVHPTPTWFYSPTSSRRLKAWITEQNVFAHLSVVNGIKVPPTAFNLVYVLIHIYRHLFDEGIGLRQLMDYYYILLSSTKEQREKAYRDICLLRLAKFAGAVMYVMKDVFLLSDEYLLCTVRQKEGRALLADILRTGNFGANSGKRTRQSRVMSGIHNLGSNMRLVCSYPSEVLWAPLWKVWHWWWRKKRGYI